MKSNGGKIFLNIKKVKNALEVIISDTGTGIKNKQKSDLLKHGVGLSNTNERLQKMYGNEIQLMDNTPKGLTVRFTLPINKEIDLL